MATTDKSSLNLSNFMKQSDIEIAMDLVSKYYLIEDSVLTKFQKKAKEQLSQKAEDSLHTISNPTAIKLLSIAINK